MVENTARADDRESSDGVPCPAWCASAHGRYDGEEDWLHVGRPVPVADGLDAVLCVSVDPGTGESDGPYVLLGGTQLTLQAFGEVVAALVELAKATTALSPLS